MKHDDDDLGTKEGLQLQFVNGWSHMELENGHSIPDEHLPFTRGSLIRIKKSPRPDKIPDDAIAMFIDYNRTKYRMINGAGIIARTKEGVVTQLESSVIENCPDETRILYRMRVLFDERVVELWNARPEELGKNYVEVTGTETLSELTKGNIKPQTEGTR